jgi:hypothetical protein
MIEVHSLAVSVASKAAMEVVEDVWHENERCGAAGWLGADCTRLRPFSSIYIPHTMLLLLCRSKPLLGWSADYLLPGDPSHFVCSSSGTSADKLPQDPPSDDWSWAEPAWNIFFDEDCDEHGWQYARRFGSLLTEASCKSSGCAVRRRKHVRHRQRRRGLTSELKLVPVSTAEAGDTSPPGLQKLAGTSTAANTASSGSEMIGPFAIDVVIHSVPFRVRGEGGPTKAHTVGWLSNEAAAYFSRVNSRYGPSFQAQVTALYPLTPGAESLDEHITVADVLALGLKPWGARNMPALAARLLVQFYQPPGSLGLELDGAIKDRPVVQIPRHVPSASLSQPPKDAGGKAKRRSFVQVMKGVKRDGAEPPSKETGKESVGSLSLDVIGGMTLASVAAKVELTSDGENFRNCAEMKSLNTSAMSPVDAASLLRKISSYARILTFVDAPPAESADAKLASGHSTDSSGLSVSTFSLSVTVVEARGIGDGGNRVQLSSDPFVWLRLAGTSRTTSIKGRSTSGAVWNEKFTYNLLSLSWELECRLFDHGTLQEDKAKLGEVKISLENYRDGKEVDEWIDMEGGGQVRLVIKANTNVNLDLIPAQEARAAELLQRVARKFVANDYSRSQDMYRARLMDLGRPLAPISEDYAIDIADLCGTDQTAQDDTLHGLCSISHEYLLEKKVDPLLVNDIAIDVALLKGSLVRDGAASRIVPQLDSRHCRARILDISPGDGTAIMAEEVRVNSQLSLPCCRVVAASGAKPHICLLNGETELLRMAPSDEHSYWRWVAELSLALRGLARTGETVSGPMFVREHLVEMDLSTKGVYWKPVGSPSTTPFSHVPLSKVDTMEIGRISAGLGAGFWTLSVSIVSAEIKGHMRFSSRSLGGLYPFAKVTFGDVSGQTTTQAGHNPIFNSTFVFTVSDAHLCEASASARVDLFAKTVTRGDLALGHVFLPLRSIRPGKERTDEVDLSLRRTKLQLRLLAAHELPKSDKVGTCDPYCVLYPVLLDGSALGEERFSSSVQKRTTNPKWGDLFTFMGSCSTDEIAFIRIDVWDKDYGKSDDFLGRVDVPIDAFRRRGDPSPVELALKPTSSTNISKLKSYGMRISESGEPLLGRLSLLAQEVEVDKHEKGPSLSLVDESVSLRIKYCLHQANELDCAWPSLLIKTGQAGGFASEEGRAVERYSLSVGHGELSLIASSLEVGDVTSCVDAAPFVVMDGDGSAWLEVWENQRYSKLGGWGSGRMMHLLPSDPRRFSDAAGKLTLGVKSADELQAPRGWSFCRSAPTWTHEKEWEYGGSFSELLSLPVSSKHSESSISVSASHHNANVRRRMWRRRLVPASDEPFSDAVSQHLTGICVREAPLLFPVSSVTRVAIVTENAVVIECQGADSQGSIIIVEPCNAATLANLLLERRSLLNVRTNLASALADESLSGALLVIRLLQRTASSMSASESLMPRLLRLQVYLRELLGCFPSSKVPQFAASQAQDWEKLERDTRLYLRGERLSGDDASVTSSTGAVRNIVEKLSCRVGEMMLCMTGLSPESLRRSLAVQISVHFVEMLDELGRHVHSAGCEGLAPLSDESILALIQFLVADDDAIRRALMADLGRLGWALSPVPRFSSALPLKDLLRGYANSAEMKLTALIHNTVATNVERASPPHQPFETLRLAATKPHPKSWLPVTTFRLIETYVDVVEQRFPGRILVLGIVLQATARSIGTLCHQMEGIAATIASALPDPGSADPDALDTQLLQLCAIVNDAWDIISLHLPKIEERFPWASDDSLLGQSLDALRHSFLALGATCISRIARIVLKDLEREGLLQGPGSERSWQSIHLTLRDYFSMEDGLRSMLCTPFFLGKLLALCADHIVARVLGDLVRRASTGERLRREDIFWLGEVRSHLGAALKEAAGGEGGPYESRTLPLEDTVVLLSCPVEDLKAELTRLLTVNYVNCQLSVHKLLHFALALRPDGAAAPEDVKERADPSNFLGTDSIPVGMQPVDRPVFHRIFCELPSVDELKALPAERRKLALQRFSPLTVLESDFADDGEGGDTATHLKVHIFTAEGLPRGGKLRAHSYYAKIVVMPLLDGNAGGGTSSATLRTRKAKPEGRGACPVWNEDLEIVFDRSLASVQLFVAVFESGTLSDELIGSVSIPLTALALLEDDYEEASTSATGAGEWYKLDSSHGKGARIKLNVSSRALRSDLRV